MKGNMSNFFNQWIRRIADWRSEQLDPQLAPQLVPLKVMQEPNLEKINRAAWRDCQ